MKIVTFMLLGQLPSGKNAVKNTRSGHRYPNKRFVTWRNEAMAQLSHLPRKPIDYRVRLVAEYTPGDLRVRDIAGMQDALGHLFEHVGLIENDGLIRECEWYERPLDRRNPKVVIWLEQISRSANPGSSAEARRGNGQPPGECLR